MNTTYLAIVILSAVALPLAAQRPEEAAVRARTASVQTTLRLDHSSYIPLEYATFTVSVRNRTVARQETANPFWPGNARFRVLLKDPPWTLQYGRGPSGEYFPIDPDDSSGLVRKPLAEPTIVLDPGEEVARSIRSDEKLHPEEMSTLGNTALDGATVPRWPGEYRIYYRGARADFRVVEPVLEQFIGRQIVRQYVFSDGQQEDHRAWVEGLVLLVEGQRFLYRSVCPARDPDPELRRYLGRQMSGFDWWGFRCRFERIEELREPASDIRFANDSSGRLMLEWREGSGQPHQSEVRNDPVRFSFHQ